MKAPTEAAIAFQHDGICVDAGLIADAFGMDPSAVQARMREGSITSLSEHGIDQDAGRRRLTFFHGSRRLRLVIDEAGNILRRSVLNFGDQPLPASARRPG